MKKIITAILAIFLLNFVGAYEMQKFQIAPTGLEPVSGQGTIRVYSLDGQNQIELNLYLENMMKEEGMLYEVWLVDEQTDYKLSIGTFVPTKFGGKIHFPFKQAMANPKVYDRVVITKEPMNDINPMPSSMVMAAGGLPGIADTLTMTSLLKGRYEVPKSMSSATGNAVFEVNTQTNTLTYNIILSGLESAETAAHIHGYSGPEGTAPAVHALMTGAVKSGSWVYPEADEWKILAGLSYVNVHTSKYPNGEIRGQIVHQI